MDMTSMLMPPKKTETPMMEKSEGEDKPQYPYGLKLALDKDIMDKLGMKEMPEVGEKMMLHAMITVVDLHDSTDYKSVGLQITDMTLEEDMGEKKPDAEVFYGKK